ncbi:zinc-dependent metalloprotease family protein [Roseobacter sp. SK209-2-6]|uniref:zinc-dependent metalloprotease family protein n=1 Tax=Roseobacter sp. SK209-2-6 TaxID=388739 RepID=UPI0002DA372C|nr:zinc-dependent metalloprotease family protein [Roseobacter sp. SK209-2-6]
MKIPKRLLFALMFVWTALLGAQVSAQIAINVQSAVYDSQDRSVTVSGDIVSNLDTDPGISVYLYSSSGTEKATLIVNYMEVNHLAGTNKPRKYRYEWSSSISSEISVESGDQIRVVTNRQVNASRTITIESGPHQIKVLLLPTPQAVIDIEQAYKVTIAEWKAKLVKTVNDAFTLSGATSLELVLADSSDTMPEFSSFSAGLSDIQNNSSLQALRNQYQADLVIGLAPRSLGGGGLARGPCDGQPNSEVTFAATVPAGSTYSFAHEIGHLLGGSHLEANVSPTAPCRPNAAYSYAYAVEGADASNKGYRTFVTTPGASGTANTLSSGMYSNPNVQFPNGSPAGTATANNVRMFEEMAPFIAGYR